MLTVVIGTMILVSIAELGDKTQMLTLALAARYRLGPVLVGVGVAILLLQLLAVVVGGTVAGLLPEEVVGWVAGGLFVGFGVWTFATARAEDAEDAPATSRFGPTLSAFVAFLVAELGDKTQIMTATIAADPSVAVAPLRALGVGAVSTGEGTGTYFAVLVGSVLGMFAVNALVAVVGSALGARVPRALVGRVAGVIFVLLGVATLVSTIWGGAA